MALTRKWRASWLESPDSEDPIATIKFGPVEENTEKSFTLWLKNLEDYEVYEIAIIWKNEDLRISGPERLQPMEAREVHFSWTVTPSSIVLKDEIILRAKILRE